MSSELTQMPTSLQIFAKHPSNYRVLESPTLGANLKKALKKQSRKKCYLTWCIRVRENRESQGIENWSGNVWESQGIRVRGQGKFFVRGYQKYFIVYFALLHFIISKFIILKYQNFSLAPSALAL